jgi:hypothetical protein
MGPRNWGLEACWFEQNWVGTYIEGTCGEPPISLKYCVFQDNGWSGITAEGEWVPFPWHDIIQFWVIDCGFYSATDSSNFGIETSEISFCADGCNFSDLNSAALSIGAFPGETGLFNKIWILDCNISRCETGINMRVGSKFKLRESTVRDSTGNGIYLGGVPDLGADLGNVNDHGYNIIQNNGDPAAGTWDVYGKGSHLTPGNILAIGNTWDHITEEQVEKGDIWDMGDDPTECYLDVRVGTLDSIGAPSVAATPGRPIRRDVAGNLSFSTLSNKEGIGILFNTEPKNGKSSHDLLNYDKNWRAQIYRQVTSANRLLARFRQSKGFRLPYPNLSEPLPAPANIEESSVGKIKASFR